MGIVAHLALTNSSNKEMRSKVRNTSHSKSHSTSVLKLQFAHLYYFYCNTGEIALSFRCSSDVWTRLLHVPELQFLIWCLSKWYKQYKKSFLRRCRTASELTNCMPVLTNKDLKEYHIQFHYSYMHDVFKHKIV